jgi:hypothetical protein
MVKALHGAFVHRPESRLQRRKLLASHGNVGFWTACHFRLVFAIVSFDSRGRFVLIPGPALLRLLEED